MQKGLIIALLLICAAMIFFTGCTSNGSANITPQITTALTITPTNTLIVTTAAPSVKPVQYSTVTITSMPSVAPSQDPIIGSWGIANTNYFNYYICQFFVNGTYAESTGPNSSFYNYGTWAALGDNAYAIRITATNSNFIDIYNPAQNNIHNSGDQALIFSPLSSSLPAIFTTPSTETVPTNVTGTQTPVVTPYPTDISNIAFTQYTDDNFNAKYPSDWNVTYSTVSDPKSSPFVNFTSPDGTMALLSFVANFPPGETGDWRVNPDGKWIYDEFDSNYPGLSAENCISNYKYFKDGNAMAATYDATIPVGSQFYPLTYTEETIVNSNRLLQFKFINRNKNPDAYNNLKEYIMSSISINGGGN
jgi:hypothetical protein